MVLLIVTMGQEKNHYYGTKILVIGGMVGTLFLAGNQSYMKDAERISWMQGDIHISDFKYSQTIQFPNLAKVKIVCQGYQMTPEDIKAGLNYYEKANHHKHMPVRLKPSLDEVFRNVPNTAKILTNKGIEATISEAPIIEKIFCFTEDE